jgi:hypothetical protein
VAVTAAAKVIGAATAWRLAGNAAAGRALLTAVTRGEETEQTLAAMMLVRAGDRSVPLVTDALLAGSADPTLVDVLASIGTDRARAALRTVSEAREPTVAAPSKAAATEALRTLDEIGRQGDPDLP